MDEGSISRRATRLRRVGWALFVAVALLRLALCAQIPTQTNDVLRHGLYGLEVADKGLAVADRPLGELSPYYEAVAFSWLPFNYPVLLLLFDVAVMAVWPSVFFFKLCLTLADLAGAALLARFTGSRAWGLFYWCLPSFVWWTSHEGQMDGLQNVPLLGALALIRIRPAVAWGLLALAVQCKAFAILAAPWMLWRTVRDREAWPRTVGWAFLGGAVGSLPTLVGALSYSPIRNLLVSMPLRYNPYFWDVTFREMFGWNPTWLIVVDQVASYGWLVVLLTLLIRPWDGAGRDPALIAPVLLLILVKASSQAQFWYFLILPALLTSVADPRRRRRLLLAVPLLDLGALVQLVAPFGYVADWPPITAFALLTVVPPG